MGSFLYLVCYTFCTLLSLNSSFLLLTNKLHPSPALLKSLLRPCTIRGRSHIAPKNAWKTLGALLSPFFQSARAVALRRRLSLLSNHQLRSPLQEGNFVTWPAVRSRHSEKLRCFYLDAARTRLEKTSASHRDCVASIMSAHTARLHLK